MLNYFKIFLVDWQIILSLLFFLLTFLEKLFCFLFHFLRCHYNRLVVPVFPMNCLIFLRIQNHFDNPEDHFIAFKGKLSSTCFRFSLRETSSWLQETASHSRYCLGNNLSLLVILFLFVCIFSLYISRQRKTNDVLRLKKTEFYRIQKPIQVARSSAWISSYHLHSEHQWNHPLL